MTPDSFFYIKPDLKPGAIPRDSGDHRFDYRPKTPPNTTKDFKKILADDKENENPVEDVNEKAKKIPEEKDKLAEQDPTTTKQEKMEKFVKDTTQPDYEIDPRFNQTATIGKDSKVAPKLGKEMTVAPSEEPRAAPYIEKAKGAQQVEKGTNEGKIAQNPQSLPQAMPLEKTEMKTPSNVAIEKPKTPMSEASNLPHSKTASHDASKDKKSIGAETPEVKVADAGQVNLMSGPIAPPSEAPPGEAIVADAASFTGTRAGRIPNQIQQIIDQITVTVDKSQTDTTITLNHPGTFQGAVVTVTQYHNAPGEFNVTFENLTQEGKNILDLADNRAALKQALDQKGYVVHMITTTTTLERTYTAEAQTPGREGRGDARGGASEQEQREKEEEKE